MFNNISEFAEGSTSLEYDKNGEPTSFDAKVAVVALLSRMACSDGTFSSEELASIVSSLTKEFDLSESTIGQFLDVARLLTQDETKAKKLLEVIRDQFSPSQRERVLAIIWRLIMADGRVDKHEAVMAASVRTDLGLTLEQAARARVLAEKGEVGWLADAVAVSDDSQ